jgi:LAO/AO transport system kinase
MGGLASATEDALDLLDAAGYTYLLVETVGVGQVELDVAQAADTVVVVLVPESGDGIQAMKAGLMEIGDVFVVNKADREGAARLKGDLLSVLELGSTRRDRQPPVVETSAVRGDGLQELLEELDRHRRHLEESGTLHRRRRDTLRVRVLGEIREAMVRRLLEERGELLESLLDRVEERSLSPHEAARQLANGAGGGPDPASRG